MLSGSHLVDEMSRVLLGYNIKLGRRGPTPRCAFKLGLVAYGEYLGVLWDTVLPDHEDALPTVRALSYQGVPVYLDEMMPDRVMLLIPLSLDNSSPA